MKYLKWLVRYIDEVVSGTALALMIGVTVSNVIARYIFSASFPWGEEVIGALCVWSVFLGASACFKRGMHIGIDIFVGMLPPAPKAIVRIFVSLVVVFTSATLAYLSLIFSLSAWTKHTQVLEIRYTFIDIPAFLGFGLMTIYAIRQFIDEVRRRGAPADESGEAGILGI